MFQNIFARFKASTEPEAQVNNKIADQPPKESLIDGYAVVDVETTGLFPSRDRIIEIAIISIDKNLQIEEEFTTLINPVRDLGATNIHQITAAMVSEAPRFEEVAGDVIKRIKNRKIVGHNVQFDVSMLLGELARLNITVKEPPRLCTLRLAYKLGPSKRNLRACCEHFGIPLDRPHCALEDAL